MKILHKRPNNAKTGRQIANSSAPANVMALAFLLTPISLVGSWKWWLHCVSEKFSLKSVRLTSWQHIGQTCSQHVVCHWHDPFSDDTVGIMLAVHNMVANMGAGLGMQIAMPIYGMHYMN